MVLRDLDIFQRFAIYLYYAHIFLRVPHMLEDAAVAPFGQNIHVRYASSNISGRDGKSTARLF
jgi:hypothetical protein